MIRFIDEPSMIAPIEWDDINAELAITAFSPHIFDELLRVTGAKFLRRIPGGCDVDVYTFELNGKTIAVYRSPIGAPAAASTAEEILACGVKKLIAFGICGTLIHTPPQTIIVPTEAHRDEGTSYHYLPAEEKINVKNADEVGRVLNSLGIKTVVGGVWTTDGFYRETRTRAEEMRKRGCVAVDMECSALQAVADFRGKQFYTFFISADSLAGEEWQPNDILQLEVTDSTTVACTAAVKLAKAVADN